MSFTESRERPTAGAPRSAMVFAAGRGERLGPLTAVRAKPALPFCGVPLLSRILAWLAAGGIEDAAVNLHAFPETIEPLLRSAENRASAPLRIHRSPEPDLLGTSGGLSRALGRFPSLVPGSAAPLLVVNGDTLPTLPLADLAAFHRRSGGEATLLADPDPGPEFAQERRLEAGPDGGITGLSPPGGPGLGFSGVWLLGPEALRHLSGRPGGLSADLLPGLIAAGAGRAFPSRRPCFEIGTPRRYLRASLCAIESGAFSGELDAGAEIGAGARVERSILLEGVSIGAGATVRDSVVAPGETVSPGALVENALFAGGVAAPLR